MFGWPILQLNALIWKVFFRNLIQSIYVYDWFYDSMMSGKRALCTRNENQVIKNKLLLLLGFCAYDDDDDDSVW